MQVIKIDVNGDVGIIDIDFSNMESVYDVVGGFEIVRTVQLRRFFNEPVVMVVDDNGFAHGRHYNHIASDFYEGDIVGNVLLVPEEYGEFVEFNDINESCLYLQSFYS